MIIYVSSSVIVKLDEYVEFLMRTCHYSVDETETRRWEVEYQVNKQCNPILMKSGSSRTIKFKSVLQRQEIERFGNNRSQLMKIIKRRKGNKGNTQWIVDYIVSDGGDVFITAIKCYNTFSECLSYQGLQQLINECVDKCLKKYLNENVANTLKGVEYLYHATPSCYVNSIKKYGLGGKMPKIRFWDYEGSPYENITQGCFLATDEYVAESYVENSETFEELAEIYEERFDKELGIIVFRINVNDLNPNLLSIDKNQILDDNVDPTYFYDGIIPFRKLEKVKLYENKIPSDLKSSINETLNNFDAPLYHNTSMENLIKMMSSNSIKSDYHRGYNTQDTHNGICFTRYKTYNPYTYYDVRLTFDVNKIGKLSRGLTLVSYQDKEWADLDEYEERLVSRNGKPFILNNLSDMITEVVIVLDRTCNDIIENGYDVDDYIEDLKHITQYNIFGEKLKIVDNLKSMNRMSINDACDYIIDQCADDEYYNSYQVYCVEYYDVSDESWEYSEYTQNRNEAIKTAKQMYEDDGIPTRVTFGEYDGQEYELSSIVQKFGNVDW